VFDGIESLTGNGDVERAMDGLRRLMTDPLATARDRRR
jgi:hypothetical protein